MATLAYQPSSDDDVARQSPSEQSRKRRATSQHSLGKPDSAVSGSPFKRKPVHVNRLELLHAIPHSGARVHDEYGTSPEAPGTVSQAAGGRARNSGALAGIDTSTAPMNITGQRQATTAAQLLAATPVEDERAVVRGAVQGSGEDHVVHLSTRDDEVQPVDKEQLLPTQNLGSLQQALPEPRSQGFTFAPADHFDMGTTLTGGEDMDLTPALQPSPRVTPLGKRIANAKGIRSITTATSPGPVAQGVQVVPGATSGGHDAVTSMDQIMAGSDEPPWTLPKPVHQVQAGVTSGYVTMQRPNDQAVQGQSDQQHTAAMPASTTGIPVAAAPEQPTHMTTAVAPAPGTVNELQVMQPGDQTGHTEAPSDEYVHAQVRITGALPEAGKVPAVIAAPTSAPVAALPTINQHPPQFFTLPSLPGFDQIQGGVPSPSARATSQVDHGQTGLACLSRLPELLNPEPEDDIRSHLDTDLDFGLTQHKRFPGLSLRPITGDAGQLDYLSSSPAFKLPELHIPIPAVASTAHGADIRRALDMRPLDVRPGIPKDVTPDNEIVLPQSLSIDSLIESLSSREQPAGVARSAAMREADKQVSRALHAAFEAISEYMCDEAEDESDHGPQDVHSRRAGMLARVKGAVADVKAAKQHAGEVLYYQVLDQDLKAIHQVIHAEATAYARDCIDRLAQEDMALTRTEMSNIQEGMDRNWSHINSTMATFRDGLSAANGELQALYTQIQDIRQDQKRQVEQFNRTAHDQVASFQAQARDVLAEATHKLQQIKSEAVRPLREVAEKLQPLMNELGEEEM